MSDVLFEKRPDGVGLITLNRPESLNAMGGELISLLAHYLTEAEKDQDVRCVALTGAGRGFCAGGDVKGMQSRNSAAPGAANGGQPDIVSSLERGVRELRGNQEATALRLHTMGKPTVALVNGAAAGAGLSLALSCDIRIASENAKFLTAFKGVGLSGDFGSSYFLPRLVGMAKARELFFTNEVLSASRALELGMVNQVLTQDRFMEDGLAFCAKIASGPTATYARMKQNINFAETSTLKELLDNEAMNMRMSGMSIDSREAVRAFVEKREPNFVGL